MQAELRRGIIRRFAQILAQWILMALALFVAAGSWTWTRGWIFLVLWALLLTANLVWVLPRNPEIIAERGRRHHGTRPFDKVIIAIHTVAVAAVFLLSPLDAARFQWAPLGWPWAVLGGVLLALGDVPVAGAMAVNRNLETTVRIQSDRGHQVATTGPYRVVRHPMYLGLIVSLPGIPLLLGSTWGLLPVAVSVSALVVRTALEDRTLLRELPGFADYAARTRCRLLPGVW